MPYVIVTGHSAKFGDSYYAGPVEAMQMAAIPTSQRAQIEQVSDINEATRVPFVFGTLADQKANDLRRAGYPAHVVYDTPKPVKALKWLLGMK